MISDDLPTDAHVDEELAALIPFARAVWEALPLPSRTVGSPDMDTRAFLETAESQLFGTCYWLKAEAERPKRGGKLSDGDPESVGSKEGHEPPEHGPYLDLTRHELSWHKFRNMLDRFGIDPPETSPPPGIDLHVTGAQQRELELAVPGLREAMLDAIDLLPTAEQRSAVRAVLRMR